MVKNLETVDDPALECILKYSDHKDKLNLRKTSKRMYDRVTELDSNFKKYWTFNPLDKEDLPEFVINTEKSFRIHIKYPKRNYERDSAEESDEESDEENYEEEMIENLKNFLRAYSTRIVSFTITCDSDDYDEEQFYFFGTLLREISIVNPKWVNLKDMRICYKYNELLVFNDFEDDFLPVEISDALFGSCQDSLQTLDFTGVQIKYRKGMRFWNLRSLDLTACRHPHELVRSVAPHLEVFKMNSMQPDLMIEGGNFSKLKVLHVDWPNLSCELLDILLSCHLTLEEIFIDPADFDFSTLDVDFPKLKSIYMGSDFGELNGAENLLNRCSSSLEKLQISSDLDFSKLKSIYPKLIWFGKYRMDKESSKPCLVEFLNRCPRLEVLRIDYQRYGSWNELSIPSVQEKIENIPLKQLSCTNIFMAYISVTSCQHISELNINNLQTASTLEGLKFPALNFLGGGYTPYLEEEKKITDLVFEDVQWVKNNGSYERAYISED